jgi:hypothetical protein
MFDFFHRYPWFLQVHRYVTQAHLLSELSDRVIEPAEAKVLEIRATHDLSTAGSLVLPHHDLPALARPHVAAPRRHHLPSTAGPLKNRPRKPSRTRCRARWSRSRGEESSATLNGSAAPAASYSLRAIHLYTLVLPQSSFHDMGPLGFEIAPG